MKKIKIFILTYKRNDVLNRLLKNLFEESDFKDIENSEVNIINNHSEIDIDNKYINKVNVIHNMSRPDMRGKIGETLTIYGDIFYDYAKIYQSCLGYDFILNDKEHKNEELLIYFEDYIKNKFGDLLFNYMKYLTASLIFSLIPLHDNEKCNLYYKLINKII